MLFYDSGTVYFVTHNRANTNRDLDDHQQTISAWDSVSNSITYTKYGSRGGDNWGPRRGIATSLVRGSDPDVYIGGASQNQEDDGDKRRWNMSIIKYNPTSINSDPIHSNLVYTNCNDDEEGWKHNDARYLAPFVKYLGYEDSP